MKAACPWLTPNQMQTCLNKDSKYIWEFLMKYPFVLILLVLFTLSGISLVTVSLLCDVRFTCTAEQKINTITFGMNICLLVFVFIVLPCLLRGCLNCLFTEKASGTIVMRPPVRRSEKIRVLVQESPLKVKRTNSRSP